MCRWVPVKERSRSLALVYSGMFLGSILGLSTSPQMILAMGWPSLFHIFGSLGIVWFFVWQVRPHASACPHGRSQACRRTQRRVHPHMLHGTPVPLCMRLCRRDASLRAL